MNGLLCHVFTLSLLTGTALSAESAPSDEALTLAACRGRYAALLEHAWLMEDNVEAVRLRRDMLAAMADALSDDDTAHQLLLIRIAQKRAAADLLTTARFGTDPRRARHALGLISRQIALCDRLLIGLPGFGT